MVKFLLILFVISCGTDSKQDKQDKQTKQPEEKKTISLALNSAAELPACTEDNNNQLVYLKDSNNFEICFNGLWSNLDIKGETGAKGAPGGGNPFYLYDANGKKIGQTAVNTFGRYPSTFQVLLEDNSIIYVNEDGTAGQYVDGCYYESNDCSGACKLAVHDEHLVVVTSNNKYIKDNNINEGGFTFESYDYEASCTKATDTLNKSYGTVDYTLPKGISFPLATPISLRP